MSTDQNMNEFKQSSLSENASADPGKNRSGGGRGPLILVLVLALAVICLLVYMMKKPGEKKPAEEPQSGVTAEQEQTVQTEEESAGEEKTAKKAETAETAVTAVTAQESRKAGTGNTAGEGPATALSPEMQTLDQNLRTELSQKGGNWSLYLYCLDNGQEIGINANDPMISASLIKLYIAGCYFEQVEKGLISDDYQSQLYSMISASDNGATNQLIDLLGMDAINAFIQEHNYKAGQLNRKMLEQNGTENYTSTRDCGMVLRDVYKGTYVNKDASARILEAMRGQIDRNLNKIPAGVPAGVDTANKTGELLTTDSNGMNVLIQNDAAIVFAEGHPYVLVVMTATSGVGEPQMQQEIAAVSSEVYNAVVSMDTGNVNSVHSDDSEASEASEAGSAAGTAAENAEGNEGAAENSSTDSTDSTESSTGTSTGNQGAGGASGAAQGAVLEDGTYIAEFNTDSTMFSVNEAKEGKGTLTVVNGQMTIHVSLVSKGILKLFPGSAEEAQQEGAAVLEPTIDEVTYSDGTKKEVFGFDIPVPVIGEEFNCAIAGEKGKWYDHKVSVTNPVKAE